ncbi:glycoside hydrolase family 16 protein [Gayadomonas joobiniege]|uniref:glycoside hydrolase family 16 protein n=1 Tax=Gayadomonas joobiniege TaxID=1234606 RepID=UPI000373AAAB|nr:glycoside hydrolase family 16 protein [Gayadomonas joobiniege]
MDTKITPLKFKAASCFALLSAALYGCGGDVTTETNYQAVDPAEPVSDWTLVWSDEFEGDQIDSKKWSYEINCDGGGNQEQQCYTDSDENAYLEDGMLHIVAKPAEEGSALPYTSARLRTKDKADWTYGRFEIRAKLPSGQGSWPAFWMLPTDNVYGGWPHSGEIDILEAVNLKVPLEGSDDLESSVHGTLHYGKSWPNNASSGTAYTFPQDQNPADDFHTYAIEWQKGEIRWYVDGTLYATQRKSETRINSLGQVTGLRHRGWFANYYDPITGELTDYYTDAPFNQDFHLLLNLAVGGSWAGSVNQGGIDAAAFANGQHFVVDYVRVYECSVNPNTGAGCETVAPGYNDDEDKLVEGAAPIPSPPSTGNEPDLTIFDDAENSDWPLWVDSSDGAAEVVQDDEYGAVAQFTIGASPTVAGFITRDLDDPKPYNATSKVATGTVEFDFKMVSAPETADAQWYLKVEGGDQSNAADLAFSTGSVEKVAPVLGQWQHYTFKLSDLESGGLDPSGIFVNMIFPAWGQGAGAVYQIDNFVIGDGGSVTYPELVLFEDQANADWQPWDCCGGSTPIEVMDDGEHGNTVEFTINGSTVVGFKPADGSNVNFNATALEAEGVLQFDLKVMSQPTGGETNWLVKVESGAQTGAIELDLTESLEGTAPKTGEWQTYTFPISQLTNSTLDPSAIDVIMVFPAWGPGDGAVFRLDNVKIYHPNADNGTNSGSGDSLVLVEDSVSSQFSPWDCCGGSTPVVVDDETQGTAVEFTKTIGETVLGFFVADGQNNYDASHLVNSGVLQFDMKVTNLTGDFAWFLKLESTNNSDFVQLDLTASNEGHVPVEGQWQTYTFDLSDLDSATLDLSDIKILMVFPAWESGAGTVYRIDNFKIYQP